VYGKSGGLTRRSSGAAQKAAQPAQLYVRGYEVLNA
jgi:hypothetical protein